LRSARRSCSAAASSVRNTSLRRPNAPPAFRGQEGAAQSASIADLPWWEVFQDQTLQGLVRTAIANNYDLRIAVRRVEQARELSVQARSQYYPGAGYEVGQRRQK
jgi:multidrug efflux system outer membrane protein